MKKIIAVAALIVTAIFLLPYAVLILVARGCLRYANQLAKDCRNHLQAEARSKQSLGPLEPSLLDLQPAQQVGKATGSAAVSQAELSGRTQAAEKVTGC